MTQKSAPKLSVEQIARVCHDANLCYSEIIKNPVILGRWDELDDGIRASVIRGVEFAIANKDASPQSQHEAWCCDKLADGWVYGPEKSVERREHPCLVAYDHLPPEERRKDALFQAVVRALAA